MNQDQASTPPLEELKLLDAQVEMVTDLSGLKPIFYRLEEIAKQNGNDFEVQLMISDIKQHLVNKGMRLKESQGGSPPGPFEPPQFGAPYNPSEGGGYPSSGPAGPGMSPAFPGSLPTEAMPHMGASVQPQPTGMYPSSGVMSPPSGLNPPSGMQPPPGYQQQAPPPPPPPPRSSSWKKAVLLGGLIALLLFAAFIVVINLARKRNIEPKPPLPTATVDVDITTTPPGAVIKINNEVKCASNCRVHLEPGNYQVNATLDGYEPVASGVTVTNTPLTVNLPPLIPQGQTVRLFPELEAAKYTFDDQPIADLAGEVTIDKVKPGKHAIKITSKTGEASFAFNVEQGKAPALQGPVTARNLVAIVVSGAGNQAHVQLSSGSAKVSLDGQPQGDTGQTGLDLKSVTPGDHELIVGEGKDQRKMVLSLGSAPMLTAYFKSDLNVGTLVVVTGEDDATVFLNDREVKRKTVRGQVRLPAFGPVKIRVVKDGFQNEPEQTANVKKGEEAKVEFKLRPLPKVAVLQIRGGIPGTQVTLDKIAVGKVAPDGSLTHANVSPGEHTIELQREQFGTKRIQRMFKAGETVALSQTELAMVAAIGTLHLQLSPADSVVTVKKSDEPQSRTVREANLTLGPGSYLVIARAAGYAEKRVNVEMTSGETKSIDLTLIKEKTVVVVKSGGMADWENPDAWTKEGDIYVHKGAGFVFFKPMPTAGTFTFTIQMVKHSGIGFGRLKWVLDYVDGKNYALFELDKKKFYPHDIVNGRTIDRESNRHDQDKLKAFTIQIDVTADRIVHRMRDQSIVLDSWTDPGHNFPAGKFGFLVQGSDEIGISDFKFTPR